MGANISIKWDSWARTFDSFDSVLIMSGCNSRSKLYDFFLLFINWISETKKWMNLWIWEKFSNLHFVSSKLELVEYDLLFVPKWVRKCLNFVKNYCQQTGVFAKDTQGFKIAQMQ